MNAATPVPNLRSDWHRVGSLFSVQLSVGAERIDIVWQPRLPTKHEFELLRPQYVEVRNLFLAEVARHMSRPVICVEVPS